MNTRRLFVSGLLFVGILLLIGAWLAPPTSAAIGSDDWSQSNKVVELPSGIQMQYVEIGPSSGQPLVLLHGWNDLRSEVLTFMGYKHHIFALDMRGYGDANKPATGNTLEPTAGDVIAFMDALNIEQADIVGHAMGRDIARSMVADYPERVNKVYVWERSPRQGYAYLLAIH